MTNEVVFQENRDFLSLSSKIWKIPSLVAKVATEAI